VAAAGRRRAREHRALARDHRREVRLDVAEVGVAPRHPPAARRQPRRDLDHLADRAVGDRVLEQVIDQVVAREQHPVERRPAERARARIERREQRVQRRALPRRERRIRQAVAHPDLARVVGGRADAGGHAAS